MVTHRGTNFDQDWASYSLKGTEQYNAFKERITTYFAEGGIPACSVREAPHLNLNVNDKRILVDEATPQNSVKEVIGLYEKDSNNTAKMTSIAELHALGDSAHIRINRKHESFAALEGIIHGIQQDIPLPTQHKRANAQYFLREEKQLPAFLHNTIDHFESKGIPLYNRNGKDGTYLSITFPEQEAEKGSIQLITRDKGKESAVEIASFQTHTHHAAVLLNRDYQDMSSLVSILQEAKKRFAPKTKPASLRTNEPSYNPQTIEPQSSLYDYDPSSAIDLKAVEKEIKKSPAYKQAQRLPKKMDGMDFVKKRIADAGEPFVQERDVSSSNFSDNPDLNAIRIHMDETRRLAQNGPPQLEPSWAIRTRKALDRQKPALDEATTITR